MLELPITTSLSNLIPSIIFNYLNDFPEFNSHNLRIQLPGNHVHATQNYDGI